MRRTVLTWLGWWGGVFVDRRAVIGMCEQLLITRRPWGGRSCLHLHILSSVESTGLKEAVFVVLT